MLSKVVIVTTFVKGNSSTLLKATRSTCLLLTKKVAIQLRHHLETNRIDCNKLILTTTTTTDIDLFSRTLLVETVDFRS